MRGVPLGVKNMTFMTTVSRNECYSVSPLTTEAISLTVEVQQQEDQSRHFSDRCKHEPRDTLRGASNGQGQELEETLRRRVRRTYMIPKDPPNPILAGSTSPKKAD